MNCHVCNRNNAFDLSICPSCGAMMNDSVRRELLPKTSVSKPLPPLETSENFVSKSGELSESSNAKLEIGANERASEIVVASAPPPSNVVEEKTVTGNLTVKTTSPTLVEFHSKKSSVPEWRVQLQNAVRQRQDRENAPPEVFKAPTPTAAASSAPARKSKFAVSGANALKIETVQERKPAPSSKNPTLSSALERIEKSRQKFFVDEDAQNEIGAVAAVAAPRPASKNFPFYIASKQTEIAAKIEASATTNDAAKPKLAAAIVAKESGELDTNKLPPLSTVLNRAPLQPISPPAETSASFAKESIKIEAEPAEKIEVKKIENDEIAAPEAERHEEAADDCAPFALRFNAGLFDLIIGAFSSLILLAPFMLTGGGTDWMSFTGVLAFLATCSIVMFIYLTTTVGFYGRTFGMRLFSLEVVDIEGENYPTLHQSAVSAAVYLLSLAFGGAGFLTALFNDERRAAHDLISGTIVVKEI